MQISPNTINFEHSKTPKFHPSIQQRIFFLLEKSYRDSHAKDATRRLKKKRKRILLTNNRPSPPRKSDLKTDINPHNTLSFPYRHLSLTQLRFHVVGTTWMVDRSRSQEGRIGFRVSQIGRSSCKDL